MRGARAGARSRIHRGMLKGITVRTPEMLLGRKRKGERGVNTCYPVAKVFPSGWNENASLYTKGRSPEARARARASRPISITSQFIDRMRSSNFSRIAELCGANSAQWHNNGYDRNDRLVLCDARGICNVMRIKRCIEMHEGTHIRILQDRNIINNYT